MNAPTPSPRPISRMAWPEIISPKTHMDVLEIRERAARESGAGILDQIKQGENRHAD